MKSKHFKGKSFSVQVCDAIRHHVCERISLESKPQNAFEDRDAALELKHEIRDASSREYLEACRTHSDAIAMIDSLNASIKWHRNQIDELVTKADEPELDFMYDPPEPDEDRQLELKPADTRPVGRPGKPKPAEPSPEMGADGHNEHLKASIAELDVNEKRKSLVAHFETIGGLAHWWESYCWEDLSLALTLDGASEADLKAILKALKKFRAAHRTAMAETAD